MNSYYAFAVLGYYAEWVGCLLPTVRDSLSFPFSGVKQSSKNLGILDLEDTNRKVLKFDHVRHGIARYVIQHTDTTHPIFFSRH